MRSLTVTEMTVPKTFVVNAATEEKDVIVLARDDRKRCPRCGHAWDRHAVIPPGTSRRAIHRLDAKGKFCPR